MIAGREVALAALTVLDASPPEIVDVAAAAGFDMVTLRIADSSRSEPNPLAGDTPLRRETIARLAHHGLGVLDAEVIRLQGDTDVAALRPTLESAAALGARNVLAIGNEPDEELLVERFAELCEEVAAFDMRAALEFMVFTACRTLHDACRIVGRVQHPAAAVLVDPLHLQRSGGTPEEVGKAVAEHAAWFPYVQLCDAPLAPPDGGRKELYREAVERRLAPGEGELPLTSLLAGLGACLPLSIETPVWALRDRSALERARHAIEATRSLLARLA